MALVSKLQLKSKIQITETYWVSRKIEFNYIKLQLDDTARKKLVLCYELENMRKSCHSAHTKRVMKLGVKKFFLYCQESTSNFYEQVYKICRSRFRNSLTDSRPKSYCRIQEYLMNYLIFPGKKFCHIYRQVDL